MTERILLTPTEAADHLRLSKSKVYLLIKEGTIPSLKIGGVIRVPFDALKNRIRELVEQTNAGSETDTGAEVNAPSPEK